MKHNCSCWCWFWYIISIITDTSNQHPTRQKKNVSSIYQFSSQKKKLHMPTRLHLHRSTYTTLQQLCVCVSLPFNDAFKNEYFPIPSPSICYHTNRTLECMNISKRQWSACDNRFSCSRPLRSNLIFDPCSYSSLLSRWHTFDCPSSPLHLNAIKLDRWRRNDSMLLKTVYVTVTKVFMPI